MGQIVPLIGMVMVIIVTVSNMVISKAAISNGLDKNVLIVYSSVLSTLIFLLCGHIGNRSSERPRVTWSVLWKLFLLSLFGFLSQICGYAGIEYSSPMLGTAMLNVIPAFTFMFAIVFRMEDFSWKSISSIAKLLGTLISIVGAFVVTLYKGPTILNTSWSSFRSTAPALSMPKSVWILGGSFFAADALFVSASYNLAAMVLKKFPDVMRILLFCSVFSMLMCTSYSLFVIKDARAWRLGFDAKLVAILYKAVIATVFGVSLSTWCLRRTGPFFVSMFKPLAVIFAVVMDIVFLGETLHLGSLIGVSVTVLGFYSVLWGKTKEQDIDDSPLQQNFQEEPLLQTKV